MSKAGWHDLPHRSEGAEGRLLDADAGHARRLQGDSQRDHLVAVEQQRGQLAAGVKPVAPVHTHRRLNAVTHLPDTVDIAAHHAVADVQPLGEHRARPVASGLQKRQQLQQAGRRGDHSTLALGYDIPGQTGGSIAGGGSTRRESNTTVTDQSVFVSIGSDSLDERRGHWDALTVYAVIVEPLAASAWSAGFGMLTDRFGVTWSVSVTAGQAPHRSGQGLPTRAAAQPPRVREERSTRGATACVVQYCSVSQAMLQTDRIRLIPLGDEHLEFEVELDSDPEVMRYLTGDGRTRAQVEKAHGLRLATAQAVAGLGFWVGFVDDEFVGWWLLQPAGWGEETLLPGQVELGYRLLRRHWGQGLATEGAREMVRHAFRDLDMQRVFALTMTVNERSRATMASTGLQYIRTFYDDDDDREGSELGAVEYALTRDQWQTIHIAHGGA